MDAQPYTAETDSDGKWYVDGPGNGLGYYSGTLWPELRFKTEEEAIRATAIANIAYERGQKAAQYAIRKALGINED